MEVVCSTPGTGSVKKTQWKKRTSNTNVNIKWLLIDMKYPLNMESGTTTIYFVDLVQNSIKFTKYNHKHPKKAIEYNGWNFEYIIINISRLIRLAKHIKYNRWNNSNIVCFICNFASQLKYNYCMTYSDCNE